MIDVNHPRDEPGFNWPGSGYVFGTGSARTLFAQEDDEGLIHISKLGETHGKLVCLDCGGALTPVRGRIRVHHFRHLSGTDCSSAGETALHRMAKEIISEGGALHIPPLQVSCNVSARDWKKEVFPARRVLFDRVDLQVREGNIHPDLICTKIGHSPTAPMENRLLVEIRVTHAVGAEKLQRFVERGESALEIDLSKIRRSLTLEELTDHVLKSAPRAWLFHRKAAEAQADFREAKMNEARRIARTNAAWRQAAYEPVEPPSQNAEVWLEEERRRWRSIYVPHIHWGGLHQGGFNVPVSYV
ncbi:hypothetical protein [Thioclava sp. F28-4]|uniref:hypothetical protein n=1 Tax=Thioclava sp. F28-4 TaxID=1915315 RepID=UPI0011BA6313|nr:hypothetical protein [Thioclava sp. F28-4]